MANFSEKASLLKNLANYLRWPYQRHEYGDAALPMIVLLRFDSVLETTKENVLKEYKDLKKSWIDNLDRLTSTAWVTFYNVSEFTVKTLLDDQVNIEANLMNYLAWFSPNIADIFENFEFSVQIKKLVKWNRLFWFIEKLYNSWVDFHPSVTSNHEMWQIFEELIRQFAEENNKESGEHFTPRDIVDIMTNLLFIEDIEDMKSNGYLIKKIYDPTCWTGWMLTSSKEFIENEINPDIIVRLYGQELNPKTYAISKSDMLLKGDNSDNIRWPSSTLSDDRFENEKFDYMMSNPPYWTDWGSNKEEAFSINTEFQKWEDSRFMAGLPGKSDAQLLFIQHLVSKMKTNGEKSRIAIITNGTPLFTWDAESWESKVRQYLIENDLIEAMVALPEKLFFNTSIGTYIWILSNKKSEHKKNKIQLIDATWFASTLSKSLWNKTKYIDKDSHNKILDLYNKYENNEFSMILDSDYFKYTKISVYRPLQLNFNLSEERLNRIHSLNTFVKINKDEKNEVIIQAKEIELEDKQTQVIELLKSSDLFENATYNQVYNYVKIKLSSLDFVKDTHVKAITMLLGEHNDEAVYITDKKWKVLANTELKDFEKIPAIMNIDEYFTNEVLKYYPEAWTEEKENKIWYDINFSKIFYKYEEPKDLDVINSEILELNKEIISLFNS